MCDFSETRGDWGMIYENPSKDLQNWASYSCLKQHIQAAGNERVVESRMATDAFLPTNDLVMTEVTSILDDF